MDWPRMRTAQLVRLRLSTNIQGLSELIVWSYGHYGSIPIFGRVTAVLAFGKECLRSQAYASCQASERIQDEGPKRRF